MPGVTIIGRTDRRSASDKQKQGPVSRRGPVIETNAGYLVSLFLGALSLLLSEPELIPVVVPDFALLVLVLPDFILEWVVGVAPGPTLPSLDAPAAGCVCAEAIIVAPSIEATTRAEIASFDRMRNSCSG
jgi:hypothetical protein